jgi:hypothetical protein
MRFLQFLNFELTQECNLANDHPLCPVSDAQRRQFTDTRRHLSDDVVREIAVRAYKELGFRGLVGFHYYNEPLLEKERMLGLIEAIRKQVPAARFVLWTNGELIHPPAAGLAVFDQIWVTNYARRDYSFLKNVVPCLNLCPVKFDQRRYPAGERGRKPCLRPYCELIIDYYGNVHICCVDWAGRASPGNIFTADFAQLACRQEDILDNISSGKMSREAPPFCLRCSQRYASIDAYEPVIAAEAQKAARSGWIKRRRKARYNFLKPRATAVVLANCGVPEERIRAHFLWNKIWYWQEGVVVYLVSDVLFERLPDYVRPIRYGGPINRLNLNDALNKGIRAALDSQSEIIIRTQAHAYFDMAAWYSMRRVWPEEAVIPDSVLVPADKPDSIIPEEYSPLAMTAANWARLITNEEYSGRGGQDKPLTEILRRSGLSVNIAGRVYRVAAGHDLPWGTKEITVLCDYLRRASLKLSRQYGYYPALPGKLRQWMRDMTKAVLTLIFGKAFVKKLQGFIKKRTAAATG